MTTRNERAAPAQLKPAMSLFDVVALGLSAAIGVSIFSVVAPSTAVAGPAVLLALLIAMVPMAVFVVVYAFLGSALPRSGSSYAWPAQFVHPYLGFIVSWLRILGNAGALSLMVTIFVGYLSQLVAVPRLPTMLALLLAFYLINMLGVGWVGRTARWLVAAKLIVLGAFIFWGLPRVDLGQFHPFLSHGWTGAFAALPLLVGLYSGIESAAEAGEEIRNSKGTMGKGLTTSTLIAVVVYFGVTVVTIGVLGAPVTGASSAPLADAGRVFLGSWMNPALLLTALVSIGAAVNTLMLISARFLYAMGRDEVLPAALGTIHPEWGTPHVAITVVFICAVACLALPDSLIFLFLASNIPTVFKYGSNCLAAIGLVEKRPDIHAQAALRLAPRTVRIFGGVGIACALGILAVGLTADWRSYALLLGWGVVGTIYWWWFGRHRSLAMHERAGE